MLPNNMSQLCGTVKCMGNKEGHAWCYQEFPSSTSHEALCIILADVALRPM